MSHYEDLKPWTDEGLQLAGIAVGWLAKDHSYPRGTVPTSTFSSVAALLRNPWQPAASAGRHRCPFCRFTGGPSQLEWDGIAISVGAQVLVVPGDAHLFVAPSLVLHYIDAHEYLPPTVFLEAVIACPPMRSMDYLKRLRALGISLRP